MLSAINWIIFFIKYSPLIVLFIILFGWWLLCNNLFMRDLQLHFKFLHSILKSFNLFEWLLVGEPKLLVLIGNLLVDLLLFFQLIFKLLSAWMIFIIYFNYSFATSTFYFCIDALIYQVRSDLLSPKNFTTTFHFTFHVYFRTFFIQMNFH